MGMVNSSHGKLGGPLSHGASGGDCASSRATRRFFSLTKPSLADLGVTKKQSHNWEPLREQVLSLCFHILIILGYLPLIGGG